MPPVSSPLLTAPTELGVGADAVAGGGDGGVGGGGAQLSRRLDQEGWNAGSAGDGG